MKSVKKMIIGLVISFFFLLNTGCVNKESKQMIRIDSKSELIRIIQNYRTGSPYGMEDSLSKDDNDTVDYSKTNTQVKGVDEADIVKTDGIYTYLTSQNKVIITKTYPVDDLKVMNTITYNDFYPNLLFVDEYYLIVIGNSYKNIPYYTGMSKIYIYDKFNYDTPKDIIEIDGYINTTRKVENQLLVLANKYISYENKNEVDLPYYKINENKENIEYDHIHYKEGTYPGEFITVYNFKLDDLKKSNHFTYMGSSSSVYVSHSNIYVSQNLYNYSLNKEEYENYSYLTKIPYNSTTFGEDKTIKIKGHTLNQYSMDEFNENFRIATTNSTWDNESGNNVYIFDENLSVLSKLEGLAKGERIQSSRFMGERIYLVTFKNVDPLFVIDAKDPYNAQVLGELKIPGYSTYLHPYDENHIIGFGFETVQEKSMTKIIGLKLSLFDVTDPTTPKEMDKEVIKFKGNGYSYSELIYNPKALLFDKGKNIFAFPITESEYRIVNSNNESSYQYFYRQSFKVFTIDLNGIKYKTEITHFDNPELDEYGYNILRGIYIEDNLYTISPAKIQIHSLSNFDKLKEIELDYDEEFNKGYDIGIIE